ncbi:type IV pilus modification protein PilV [Glaciimonas sp. GG7]
MIARDTPTFFYQYKNTENVRISRKTWSRSSVGQTRTGVFSSLALHRQHGAGLIEVLIAIVITAFSLLGLADLQLAALRAQKTAHHRAIATMYSVNMAERIRANTDGARDGHYTALGTYPASAAYPSKAPSCVASSCTPAQVALSDIDEWRAGLRQAMAGGWGDISGSVKNGFVVRVYFRESGNQADTDAHESSHTNALLSKKNCRTNAFMRAADKKDVRCFSTVFWP